MQNSMPVLSLLKDITMKTVHDHNLHSYNFQEFLKFQLLVFEEQSNLVFLGNVKSLLSPGVY